ncbi:MFS transporter, partial [Pseudomonas sp. SIMBA_041]
GGPGASYLFMCGALLTAVALTAALKTTQTPGRAKRGGSHLAMSQQETLV